MTRLAPAIVALFAVGCSTPPGACRCPGAGADTARVTVGGAELDPGRLYTIGPGGLLMEAEVR